MIFDFDFSAGLELLFFYLSKVSVDCFLFEPPAFYGRERSAMFFDDVYL